MKKKSILFTLLGIIVITIIIIISSKMTTINLPNYIDRQPGPAKIGSYSYSYENKPVWKEAIEESTDAKKIIIKNICISVILSTIITVILFITKIYKVDILTFCLAILLYTIPIVIYGYYVINYIINNVKIVV